MSVRPLILEEFSLEAPEPAPMPTEVVDGERLEAERLEAYDKGYAAGWEDATSAAETLRAEQGQALDVRLEELAFTFHEARAHVMRALHPLLEAMVHSAVPKVLHDTLGARLTELVSDMAEEAADAEILVMAAPGEAEGVAAALEGRVRFPVSIHEEDTIASGMLHLRLGSSARELDMTAIETALANALSALDTINEETLSHG